MIKALKPVSQKDRIDYLDILRGMSIFFIFTANIPFFSGLWFFDSESPVREINLPTDDIFAFIHYVFVDGKFYTIFSMLFGIGCVIQFENAKSKGISFPKFFRTRMFWLLLIGLIHMFGLWPGDILTLYALLGFVLPYFVKKSDKTLLILATVLIAFPIFNWLFMHFTGLFYPGFAFQIQLDIYQYFNMPIAEFNGQLFPDLQKYLLNTNIGDFFKMNLGNGFVRVGLILQEGRIFKVFGIFLLGIWSGRKILKSDLLNNKKFLLKAFWIGLVIGLPFNILRGYLEFYAEKSDINEFFHVLSYALGTVPFAICIAASIALLCLKDFKFLNLFSSVGKTALTCYLFHTILSIIVFYGFGFNQTGKYGFTIVMGIAVLIFSLQVIISRIWLKYFRYGPMEWMWRKLTYGIKL